MITILFSISPELLAKEDCNVLSVSWPASVSTLWGSYLTVVKRIPRVGQEVALNVFGNYYAEFTRESKAFYP